MLLQKTSYNSIILILVWLSYIEQKKQLTFLMCRIFVIQQIRRVKFFMIRLQNPVATFQDDRKLVHGRNVCKTFNLL